MVEVTGASERHWSAPHELHDELADGCDGLGTLLVCGSSTPGASQPPTALQTVPDGQHP